jgi:hypothetical protein
MIKLTEYSHGQGCGCKISPKVLDTILASSIEEISDPNLLVGNHSREQNDKFCRIGDFMKYSHSKAMAVFYKIVKWVKNGVLMIIPTYAKVKVLLPEYGQKKVLDLEQFVSSNLNTDIFLVLYV